MDQARFQVVGRDPYGILLLSLVGGPQDGSTFWVAPDLYRVWVEGHPELFAD